MVETIYIARHGFRLSWVTKIWTSPTGLPKDPPLAAYGVEQAVCLANYITGFPEHKRPTLLFSSPYYRCMQTATPLAETLGLPILVEHGLSEWFSGVIPGTGLHPRPSAAPVLQQYFPAIDPSWESIYLPDRRGETVQAVHERCTDFLHALVSRIERDPVLNGHKNIILVSHAATAIALVRSLVGDNKLPLRVGTCTLSEVERRDAHGWKWEARGVLADGSFLPGGIERDWGFEDIQLDEDGSVIGDSGIPGTENEDPGYSGLVPEKSL